MNETARDYAETKRGLKNQIQEREGRCCFPPQRKMEVGHHDEFIRAPSLALLGRYAWPLPSPFPSPPLSLPSPFSSQRPGPHSFPFSVLAPQTGSKPSCYWTV